MKRTTILILVGIMIGSALVSLNLMAESITNTGMSQRALVKFLTNVVTMGNETKSDHNTLFANYTSSLATNRQMVTAHTALYNSYTTVFRAIATNNNYSTAQVAIRARSMPSAGVARSVPSTPSATTSTSNLSLTGL